MVVCPQRECLSLCFWCNETETVTPFFMLLKQNPREPGVRRITFNVTVSFIRDQKYYSYDDVRQARNVCLWCG